MSNKTEQMVYLSFTRVNNVYRFLSVQLLNVYVPVIMKLWLVIFRMIFYHEQFIFFRFLILLYNLMIHIKVL